jgi:hypothetical protein
MSERNPAHIITSYLYRPRLNFLSFLRIKSDELYLPLESSDKYFNGTNMDSEF